MSKDDLNEKPAVVLLSGGLDSMVAAGIAKAQGYRVNALTVDYNQRHRRELDSATLIANAIGVDRHLVLPLDLRKIGGSALTSEMAVPKDGVGSDIPITYVPARNLVFLSLTLAWCEAIGAQDIFIGVNALDYSGYPDCRPEFIKSFEKTAELATKAGSEGAKFSIHAPLQFMSKAEIVDKAYELGLDPSMSWSCYDPGEDGRPCGLCDSCRLRQQGFAQTGRQDPVDYRKRI
jgi:7-cyano-7-deazaguanine synthase